MTHSQLSSHLLNLTDRFALVPLIFVNQRILERSTVAGIGSAIRVFGLKKFTQYGGAVRFPLVQFSLPHLTQLSLLARFRVFETIATVVYNGLDCQWLRLRRPRYRSHCLVLV